MRKFDRLRYRLLPYIYSLAGMVSHRGGTILRPLAMDFRADKASREIDDEFMFGPAFLVNPVTSYGARSRLVYLPPAAGWYDFWTGVRFAGAAMVRSPAPFEAIPIYVRSGSIVPVGPELQYTSEKLADPITVYVYAGADGAFTLYEDEGTTYDYEKGAFSTIAFSWDDAKKTLTIGERAGEFVGMPKQRTFQVILVSQTKAVPFSFTAKADKSVDYSGAAVAVDFH